MPRSDRLLDLDRRIRASAAPGWVDMFHAGALAIWLLAAAVPAFTLRNPLYLALILGAAWVVHGALGRASPAGSSWGSLVKIGFFFFGLAIPFNALSNHSGQIVLFRLPSAWPIIGGAITLEAILAGAANALALFTILVVFAAFNAAVDHYQLLRATPAFLFQVGVVVSIAVTFVPQMVMSARDIREAQRIRGHRFRSIRDLVPFVLPLLASSLERAIQLAETMEARGFGASQRLTSRRQALLVQFATLAALLGILSGLFLAAYVSGSGVLAWVLVALGGVLLAASFWLQGRGVLRSRYRRVRWTGRDVVVLVASVLVLAAVVTARTLAPATLSYAPYPPAPLLPPFNPWVGAALLLLALPALLGPGRPIRGVLPTTSLGAGEGPGAQTSMRSTDDSD